MTATTPCVDEGRPPYPYREGDRLCLIWLLREAYAGEGRPAGATTDAATVATRLIECGRVTVHPWRPPYLGTAPMVGPPYRVGLGRDLERLRRALILKTSWRGHRRAFARFGSAVARGWRRRSWWGLWQAEHDGPELARAYRGLTPAAARRRVIRALADYDLAREVARLEAGRG